MFIIENPTLTVQGQIQDYKLGGGGANLKIFRRSEGGTKIICFPIVEGGAKICGLFRVKNHDYTPKNLIFSNCGGRREYFGVFRVKNHDFTPKNHIFSNFRGKRAGCAPMDPPLL